MSKKSKNARPSAEKVEQPGAEKTASVEVVTLDEACRRVRGGGRIFIDEVKVLLDAAQERTMAVETDGKWACRKAGGGRTITKADAFLQAYARGILLDMIAKVEPLEKEIIALTKLVNDRTQTLIAEVEQSKQLIANLTVERDVAREHLSEMVMGLSAQKDVEVATIQPEGTNVEEKQA
jgi:seryl-tRNA synthetase